MLEQYGFTGPATQRVRQQGEAAREPGPDDEELIDRLTEFLWVAAFSDEFGFDVLGRFTDLEDPAGRLSDGTRGGDLFRLVRRLQRRAGRRGTDAATHQAQAAYAVPAADPRRATSDAPENGNCSSTCSTVRERANPARGRAPTGCGTDRRDDRQPMSIRLGRPGRSTPRKPYRRIRPYSDKEPQAQPPRCSPGGPAKPAGRLRSHRAPVMGGTLGRCHPDAIVAAMGTQSECDSYEMGLNLAPVMESDSETWVSRAIEICPEAVVRPAR